MFGQNPRPMQRPPLNLALDPRLPITAHAADIATALARHPVVIVCGATGSGKSTQLPKLCLAAGRGEAGMIGCTQPRRLAARSVARRVAEELSTPLGEQVGFQVRFNDQVSDRTLVKFMTEGPIVAMIENYRSGLVWKTMRGNRHIVRGLQRAGFQGGWLAEASPP